MCLKRAHWLSNTAAQSNAPEPTSKKIKIITFRVSDSFENDQSTNPDQNHHRNRAKPHGCGSPLGYQTP